MTSLNTNISALIGLNNLRLIESGIQTSFERLSTGLRINHASDDPSGLAIAKGMEAQINDMRVAVHNSEDSISLLDTADGSLQQTSEILLRMRDLAVRAANEATLTTADNNRLNAEFSSLVAEIDRKSTAVTFNEKKLFDGTFQAGQVTLVGPNGSRANWLTIQISQLDSTTLGIASPAISLSSPLKAMNALSAVDDAINHLSDVRSSIGIQSRRLNYIINDLETMDINLSAAKSRIYDADMAEEITNLTRLQILKQFALSVLAQANTEQQSFLKLLTA